MSKYDIDIDILVAGVAQTIRATVNYRYYERARGSLTDAYEPPSVEIDSITTADLNLQYFLSKEQLEAIQEEIEENV